MDADRPQPEWSEARVADLLAELPPPPQGWVHAARELPAVRRSLDELVARAEADARLRAEVLAGLEAALQRAGHDPDPRLRAILRARLEAGAEGDS
ncbi:MAG: hypothetical protein ACRDL1_02120 [Solirubrobacterales bacterium]